MYYVDSGPYLQCAREWQFLKPCLHGPRFRPSQKDKALFTGFKQWLILSTQTKFCPVQTRLKPCLHDAIFWPRPWLGRGLGIVYRMRTMPNRLPSQDFGRNIGSCRQGIMDKCKCKALSAWAKISSKPRGLVGIVSRHFSLRPKWSTRLLIHKWVFRCILERM